MTTHQKARGPYTGRSLTAIEIRVPELQTYRIPDREGTTFVASEQLTDQERSARRDQIVETGILRLVGRPTTAHQASSVSLASVLTRCGVEARLENVVPLGRDQVDLVSGFQTGPRGEVPAGTIFFCRRCARAAWAAYERQREQGRT